MPAQHSTADPTKFRRVPDADRFSVPRQSIDAQKEVILKLLNAVGGGGWSEEVGTESPRRQSVRVKN